MYCAKQSLLFFLLTSITFILHFTSAMDLSAQNVMVKGYIHDDLSLEALPYATVYLPERKVGISANQYGYFSIMVGVGKTKMEASYVGYKTVKKYIDFKNDTTLDFYLSPPTIDEVVIVARRSENPSTRINQTVIPMTKIKEIPPLFGEYDVIKALALTPGVNTSGEGSTGLMVRGGTSDQNLVLLDGAMLYNNSHVFGFISNFNPEAISSAELIKGGFSPKFGSRLSSILNVTMKEGNLRENKTNLTVGPISSQFTTEGPLIKEKASYILSGRATYFTLITLPLYLFKDEDSDKFNYLMYDLNAKVNYKFNDREKVFLSYYSGSDIWNARSNENQRYTGVDMNWTNSTASMRYTKDFSNGLFSISQVVYNRFAFKFNIIDKSLTKPPENKTASAITSSSVEGISARQHFEFTTGIKNKIEVGFEISRQVFHPDYYKLENLNFGANIPSSRDNGHSFFSGVTYIENIYSPYSWFTAEFGLRYATEFLKKQFYQSLEPRINLQFKVHQNITYNLSYTNMTQPVFQLTNTGQGLPIYVWVPITTDIPPAKANQWSTGMKKDLEKWPISFQAEIYYKQTSGLIEYNQGVSFITNIARTWNQNVVSNGIGKAYGFELLVSKESGKFNGWLGYTLSRNYRKFDQINNGKWYFARYDRTHDIEMSGVYQVNNSWKVSGVFVISTGQPATLASTVHEDIFGNKIQVFTARNNMRMPTYHRLDLSFSKEIITKKRKRPASLSFGAYNVYNRINPFYVTLDETPVYDERGIVTGIRSRYSSGTLLGIVPFINYSIKF